MQALSPATARLQGTEAVQALAENHLTLVAAMVRRFPGSWREREELYQQGCVGLMKAIARYDPTIGAAFSTYAAAMILGEMRMLTRLEAPVHIPRRDRELRSRIRRAQSALTTTLGREPTIQELASMLRMEASELVLAMEEVSVTSMDAPSERGGQFADVIPDSDDWMNRLLIKDLIARLPRQDRQLLLLRYRFNLSQTETARRMGMTQVQVSRREMMIKAQLRRQWQEDS